MAILNAFSLFDSKALVYSPPFFVATDGLAVRAVSDLAADAGTTVGRHTSDFILYRVGTFDDATGRVIPLDPLVHVVDVISLVKTA